MHPTLTARRRTRARRPLAIALALAAALSVSGAGLGATPALAATCPDTQVVGEWRDLDSVGSAYHVSISANCHSADPEYRMTIWFRSGGGLVAQARTGDFLGTGFIVLNPFTWERITYTPGTNRIFYTNGGTTDQLYRVTGCC